MKQHTRVLLFSQGIPHPSRGASTVLYYAYINALKSAGYHVLHVCLNDQPLDQEWDEYLAQIQPDGRFQAIHARVSNYYSIDKRAFRVKATLPEQSIVEQGKSFKPDLVLCFDVIAGAVAQSIGFKDLNIWFGDLQYRSNWYNAIYDIKGGEAKLGKLFFTLLYCGLWKRLYQQLLPDTKLAIASSESSVLPLKKMGAKKSIYLPYPWPDSGTESLQAKKFEIPTFIMFGTLSALGSKSAFDFLLTQVLPILRKQWSGRPFEILVAGSRNMPSWAEKYLVACPEVKFLGFVDDLAELVSKCHAVLAPIAVPVGNRSRIITAMSMRALVIAHSNTKLGNPELVSGENCFLADTPELFAKYMIKAVDEQENTDYLSQASRQTYLSSFEPEIATSKLLYSLSDQ